MGWADLLKRTFDIDALHCVYYGGHLMVASAVHDPSAVQASIAAVHSSAPRLVRLGLSCPFLPVLAAAGCDVETTSLP
ncbi:MAG: hypothetical protein ACI9MR_001575 [Myxococcota bacterium]|jgi:hypothetical protein